MEVSKSKEGFKSTRILCYLSRFLKETVRTKQMIFSRRDQDVMKTFQWPNLKIYPMNCILFISSLSLISILYIRRFIIWMHDTNNWSSHVKVYNWTWEKFLPRASSQLCIISVVFFPASHWFPFDLARMLRLIYWVKIDSLQNWSEMSNP